MDDQDPDCDHPLDVLPGLDPGIHESPARRHGHRKECTDRWPDCHASSLDRVPVMDARIKSGHDNLFAAPM